jgi:hypothetical protein
MTFAHRSGNDLIPISSETRLTYNVGNGFRFGKSNNLEISTNVVCAGLTRGYLVYCI